MKRLYLFAALAALMALSGCASNPDIPTYSGEVRAAVTEKVNSAGTFIRGKLTSPMPAWNQTAKPTISDRSTAQTPSTLVKEEVPTSAAAGSVSSSGVEVYSLDPSAPVTRPLASQ